MRVCVSVCVCDCVFVCACACAGACVGSPVCVCLGLWEYLSKVLERLILIKGYTICVFVLVCVCGKVLD